MHVQPIPGNGYNYGNSNIAINNQVNNTEVADKSSAKPEGASEIPKALSVNETMSAEEVRLNNEERPDREGGASNREYSKEMIVFTTFKDASGQYVTRYRNVDTGDIEYIPERTFVKQTSFDRGQEAASLSTEA